MSEEIEEFIEEEVEEVEVVEDDPTALTDEELDNIADTAIAALKDVLKYFNVGEVTIDEYEGDEGELILDITGDDLAVLIGRHGKTLDALQFIISAITVRKIGSQDWIQVPCHYRRRGLQKSSTSEARVPCTLICQQGSIAGS